MTKMIRPESARWDDSRATWDTDSYVTCIDVGNMLLAQMFGQLSLLLEFDWCRLQPSLACFFNAAHLMASNRTKNIGNVNCKSVRCSNIRIRWL
jgi:hypothetical protein